MNSNNKNQSDKNSFLVDVFIKNKNVCDITTALSGNSKIHINGLRGSLTSVVASSILKKLSKVQLAILENRESALYFCNDIENLIFDEQNKFHEKEALFFPSSYTKSGRSDSSSVLLRHAVMERISANCDRLMIVTYPEAIAELMVSREEIERNSITVGVEDKIDLDFFYDILEQFQFQRVDFVVEPGQFALRGGIIDVFTFNNDFPYRIEFSSENVASIRTFDPATQLSIDILKKVTILPFVNTNESSELVSILSFIPKSSVVWVSNLTNISDIINSVSENINSTENGVETLSEELFLKDILNHNIIEFGNNSSFKDSIEFLFESKLQPVFNKNYDLLITDLENNTKNYIHNYIVTDSKKQQERISSIIDDLIQNREKEQDIQYTCVQLSIHQGFICNNPPIACYTDHQLFERYHKYKTKENYSAAGAFTIKELNSLQPGDYVTHIDHGVGRFDGLEKISNDGKEQEVVRIIYQNNDILYVSIHSLHKISKYSGKEGHVPSVDRLGSNNWNKLKDKTKSKVKDIARDLIKLYAERKTIKGFAFTPDSYLQNELEASFIYVDTPDQNKTTIDVKNDMEADFPMDRLVCGDVGFGKTEIAIRAAFKCVADSKQVAVLVPTTILALQHYDTFTERLEGFPCNVDYINRFKSSAQQKQTLEKLAEGKVDIIIGTHRLLSKDVKFKDLGLLVIDEEQKFGVSHKEKLKQLKSNVDTLTLTATPIPRTLQFSMMGARDLSIINTPPPNRYPVQTEIITFDDEHIAEIIQYEISRGGQVFFVNNRIQNLDELVKVIKKSLPDINVEIGHGQMDGAKLESIIKSFIEGKIDVLVSTTIIESGIDIPNANTIIINDAQNYGLSDLHQLRGRVGRSNRKAFCYLIAPPTSYLSDEARKRLKAIEDYSDIGSGFNIAMRDLDIRGAGNLLGAEQSGFISDIGFEMYQKILDEAIEELKYDEFKDIFVEEKQKPFVKESNIETDLEMMIPDSYISNINERLLIYKDLDACKNEDDLTKFQENIIDRFGKIPQQTKSLINAIRLKLLASTMGIEKIVLKQKRMNLYFVSSSNTDFYMSGIFTGILDFVKNNIHKCSMKESKERINLGFSNVADIQKAIDILNVINKFITQQN